MAKITIYGLAGTGTSTQGRLLAERLGYEFLSPGMLFRARAQASGMPLHQYEAFCNEHPEVDRELDVEIRQFGESHYNFVVEGRLAWFLIPDSIKIKLTCDFETRTARVAKRDGLGHGEAKSVTLVREESNERRYAESYGIQNLGADEMFDFVIDNTHLSIEETDRAILDFLDQAKLETEQAVPSQIAEALPHA